ncbi:MAG TPA: DUF5777 family beta-barrel protein [Thermoanaerobaculia bacterium]|nr:DUF5777 family beta-barrel protein [Thermoanaerobaculia bacterium]
MIRKFIVAAGVLAACSASAQTAKYAPVRPAPVGALILTLPSSHVADAGTWEVRFSHRFNQNVDQNTVHSLFGLDSGANVGIGLSYVPFRDLEIALLRNTALETYEASGKYEIVQQAKAIPFTAALRAGVDWRNSAGLADRSSLFAQAIVSRQFGRLDLYVLPTYVTNAGRVASGSTSAALFKHAINVPAGAALQLGGGFSLAAEVIPKNRDLPSSLASNVGWSAGVKHAIGGHYFEVLLTNTNAMSVDQYATSTFNGGGLRTRDRRLGFNIERRWGKPVGR